MEQPKQVAFLGLALLLAVAGFVFPAIRAAMEYPQKKWDCAMNLRQLGLALHMYAGDHKERFPDRLEEIAESEYAKQTDLLICPSSDPEVFSKASDWSRIGSSNTCYYYVAGGAKKIRPANHVQMFCPPEMHKGEGGYILFVGGYVKWLLVESSEGETFWSQLRESGITPEMVAAATNRIIHVDDLNLD